MFKRIVKVVGMVLLGFVLLIGGVVAFMAIRGDFKKQVIKPNVINFTIPESELTFDIGVDDDKVHSFIISAEPIDVTETECTIKLSNSLITFVKWENGQWVKNNTNTFYLNKPIYFVVNNVVDDAEGKDYVIDEDDYHDGVITITVKDKSGLLQDTLDLKIDRNITSISFIDQGNSDNNKIVNGLFVYENGKYNGEVNQELEAIINQDYPLEVITAPLKASKPFANKDAKLYEIYYVEQGQPKLVTYSATDNEVKLQTYNNTGDIIEENCDFLTYDATNGRYVFNSSSSGAYEFKLATYPTYAVQEEILSNTDLSFINRLNLGQMVTKTMIMTVTGTEAESVTFEGDSTSIGMQLLQDNNWIINNATELDVYNLGLTLSKANSGTTIEGRYNELNFVDSDSFDNRLTWTFRQAIVVDNEVTRNANGSIQYKDDEIGITFTTDLQGNKNATITGIGKDVPTGVEYEVLLTGPRDNKYYTLTLKYVKYDETDNTKYTTTTIIFNMVTDNVTGKLLSLIKDENDLAVVNVLQQSESGTQTYSATLYLDLQVGNCFILGDLVKSGESYDFKTLKSGLYLALLGRSAQTTPFALMNDQFVTSIDYNGADGIITIKPISGELLGYNAITLYAVVVNDNGTWTYTENPRAIVINSIDATLSINDSTLSLPIVVGEKLDYGTGFDVEDLVQVNAGSTYNQVLMFSPKYSLLTQEPADWKGLVVYRKEGGTYIEIDTSTTAFETNAYYTKNNYKTIDVVSIIENDIEYSLLGYIENGKFVNKVVATGANYYSKIYPVVIKTKYLRDVSRVQTAEEYINELLTDKYGTSDVTFNDEQVQIRYDLSLLSNKHIYKQATGYVKATESYDANKTYYIYDGSEYIVVEEIAQDIINNWIVEKTNYYEMVDYISASKVLGDVTVDDTTNINQNLTYYTLSSNGALVVAEQSIGSDEFINNWNSYYVIISHYIIKSTVNDGANIKITANAVSKGIELTNTSQQFIVSVTAYNLAKNGDDGKDNKFKVNYEKLYLDNAITATSYYDFAKSSVAPIVEFTGSYFNNEQTRDGDIYKVIAEHNTIDLTWEDDGNTKISEMDVQTGLYINNYYDEIILQSLVRKLSVKAIEYNASAQKIGVVDGNVVAVDNDSLMYVYVEAGEYSANRQYYKLDNNEYKPVTIVETATQPWEITEDGWNELVADWENQHVNYYVATITIDFVVMDVVAEGHYVKLEWTYNDGDSSYIMASPRLNILSREVKSYTIDTSKTLYQATLIKQGDAPDTYYRYDEENRQLVLVSSDEDKITYPYEKDKYYNIETIEYAGTVNYLFEVGYDTTASAYTYNVYTVDTNDNYLYYMEGEDGTTYKLQVGEASVALSLKEDGGWIKPEPFYASYAQFSIQGNEYLKFDENNQITFAQITDNLNTITLRSSDATIQRFINVKVKQDGKFTFDTINIATSDATKQYLIPTNVYKYGDSSIDNVLEISIEGFTIQHMGQNVTTQYKLLGNKIVEALDESVVIAQIDDFNGNNWIIRRETFDNITLTLKMVSLLGTKAVDFAFTSPYQISSSNTNKTSTVYSGTNYILAKTNNELVNDIDALYTLSASSGEFVIEYQEGNDTKTIGVTEHKFVFTPNVYKPTNYKFTLYYLYGDNQKELAGEFSLTVLPNVIITANVADTIKLDDYSCTTYNFSDLGLKQYVTDKEYTTYTSDYTSQDLIEVDLTNISYKYETFTDVHCTNKYITNIVDITNHVLTVNPISEIGTYYVKVSVLSGNISVGEVIFEISSKSQVVSPTGMNVASLEITANSEKVYSLDDLKQIYALQRAGEIDNNYLLSDILWLDTNNDKLTISYRYNSTIITQFVDNGKHKLMYNGVIYTLIGASHNMTGYTFDIFNNKFVNCDNEFVNNTLTAGNIAYIAESGTAIYCKQNAYLFVSDNDANNILAMSIESTGKTIYTFTVNTVVNKVELSSTLAVGNLNSLSVKYNGFGASLANNAQYVDNIEYSIETVFNNHNIKTNSKHIINILPYTIAEATDVVLTDTSYILYDSGIASDKGLFNIDSSEHSEQVTAISFGAGDGYTISTSNYIESGKQKTKYSIKFNADGNSYVATLPITLTYVGGEQFTYNSQFNVINNTVVSISYPYNVADVTASAYNVFNASISELTNGVDGLAYDLQDFAKWLGADTTVDNWKQTRMRYDLALRGDIIDLTQDELRNIVRYNAHQYQLATGEYNAETMYYTYNKTINKFDIFTGTIQPSDWGKLNYYTRAEKSSTISNIELVAVSSTYANTLQNVKDSLALNGNTIAISTSLDYTGYVAFKVYESDTSAYGYYILKIVDDTQFDNVVGHAQARRTQIISNTILDDISIIEFIKNSGHEIATVANIDNSLINNDYSNVYMFMVYSDNFSANIANGQLVANNTTLSSDSNIQTIVVAVAVQDNTSLVHVCNYKLVLQPDVTVTPNMYNETFNPTGTIESIEDASYYKYKAKPLAYTYGTDNSIDLSRYFTVTGIQGGVLTSVRFDETKSYSDLLTFAGTSLKLGDDTIATINGTSLVLEAPISTEVFFYLELTYTSQFKVYLRITLEAFEFKSTTQFTVGEWVKDENDTNNSKFNNTLALSEIFGDYAGNYTVYYWNGSTWRSELVMVGIENDIANKQLKFELNRHQYKYQLRLKVVLDDVVTTIEKDDITVTVLPSIVGEYSSEKIGANTDNRLTTNIVDQTETLTAVGSKLHAVVNTGVVKVQNANKDTTYLTINVGDFTAIKFSLTTDDNKSSAYLLDGSNSVSELQLSTSSDLKFAHSAKDENLKLTISVIIGANSYATTYVLYITLPQTYDLSPNYRVTGATYETVVNDSALVLTADVDNTSISTNFYGTTDEVVIDGDNKVYQSRISITTKGHTTNKTYYGYNNIVGLGLLSEGNPNYLNSALNITSGINISSIDQGILTFRSDNDAPIHTLVLSNNTTSIAYNFMVMTDDSDYSIVDYNKNLLQIDTNNDTKVDYIAISIEEFANGVELAYLKYMPNEDIAGQVGWVIEPSGNGLEFKFDNYSQSSSKVIVSKAEGVDVSQNHTVKIITMNGVSSIIKLVITDFVVNYGYNKGENYEAIYAGTEGYKLNGTTSSGKTRVTATVDDNDIFTDSSFAIEYYGAVNGLISHLPLGTDLNYGAGNTDLVWYDITNKVIKTRSVKQTTYVTMIFNVTDGTNIINRIYYSLQLNNDIKIGLNSAENNNNMVNLYLGSSIYTQDGEYTTINLLQSENASNYNNIYVTLEQYSTGNTIANNKALYNGSNHSTLMANVVSNYLQFAVSNLSSELVGKVSVNTNGMLKIKGNSAGSFTLSVYSANGTGYGESFTIIVSQYDNTIARFNNQISTNNGIGYASGSSIKLFNGTPTNDNASLYAFNTYRLGYDKTNNIINSQIYGTNAKVYYQVAVFDYGTPLVTIKSSSKWDKEETRKEITENINNYSLPSVKYSSMGENEYQIVSIRLTVIYNGEPQYYFANYQVYNEVQVDVNKCYEDSQTIIYGEKAWASAGEGNVITIMDTQNLGMYALVSLVTSDENWSDLYSTYYTKNESGTFTKVAEGSNPMFAYSTYYKLNDIASDVDSYTAWIRLEDGTEREISGLKFESNKITGTLPEDLFENSLKFIFVLKSVEGAILLEDEWTIKANVTIEARDSMALSNFFLQSEIGQTYYNTEVIGITSTNNYIDFVTGASSYMLGTGITLSNGDITYTLQPVTYIGNSSNDVFSVKVTYYVLVGHNTAMSFNFNGGTYYINLTVDDTKITGTSATFNLLEFIKIWSYSGSQFIYTIPTSVTAIGIQDVNGNPVTDVDYSSGNITLANVNTLTYNRSINATITISGVTRTIELYFNIIINAKAVDGKGLMAHNSTVATAMADKTALTTDEVESNIALKQALLGLIKYNNQDVLTDPATAEYNYYRITIEKQDSCYSITYIYNNEVSSYTRTLQMALS